MSDWLRHRKEMMVEIIDLRKALLMAMQGLHDVPWETKKHIFPRIAEIEEAASKVGIRCCGSMSSSKEAHSYGESGRKASSIRSDAEARSDG